MDIQCKNCQMIMDNELYSEDDYVVSWCHKCGTIWKGHMMANTEDGEWFTPVVTKTQLNYIEDLKN